MAYADKDAKLGLNISQPLLIKSISNLLIKSHGVVSLIDCVIIKKYEAYYTEFSNFSKNNVKKSADV